MKVALLKLIWVILSIQTGSAQLRSAMFKRFDDRGFRFIKGFSRNISEAGKVASPMECGQRCLSVDDCQAFEIASDNCRIVTQVKHGMSLGWTKQMGGKDVYLDNSISSRKRRLNSCFWVFSWYYFLLSPLVDCTLDSYDVLGSSSPSFGGSAVQTFDVCIEKCALGTLSFLFNLKKYSRCLFQLVQKLWYRTVIKKKAPATAKPLSTTYFKTKSRITNRTSTIVQAPTWMMKNFIKGLLIMGPIYVYVL